jgi:NTP pyrophosphatase (non-canonical NTP hydrolase)
MIQLQSLMDEVVAWSNVTFKDATAVSKSIHLQKEAKELTEALEKYYRIPSQRHRDDVKLEFADIMILLVNTANAYGITAKELIALSHIKLEINKTREWNPPDENGVCYHKK